MTSDRLSSPTDTRRDCDPANVPASPLSQDDERMVRLQQGERAAYDEIVHDYQGPLFGFFFRNTRDAQLSEDLTQETLLRVYSQFWDYLPVGRFRGWLYRIARNLLIDNIRRQPNDVLFKATRGRPDDDRDLLARLAGTVLTPDKIFDQRDLARIVEECLAQIPEDQRMTFTLHHYSGLSLPEVADVMQANLPTTKSRLRLAREKLREKLRPYGIYDPQDRPEE